MAGVNDRMRNKIKRFEAAERAQDYAMQIHLYAVVLTRLTGRAVTNFYIHFLRWDEVVPIAPDLEAAEDAVARLAQAQEEWLA